MWLVRVFVQDLAEVRIECVSYRQKVNKLCGDFRMADLSLPGFLTRIQ